jgi:hypothetical protein
MTTYSAVTEQLLQAYSTTTYTNAPAIIINCTEDVEVIRKSTGYNYIVYIMVCDGVPQVIGKTKGHRYKIMLVGKYKMQGHQKAFTAAMAGLMATEIECVVNLLLLKKMR